MLLQGYGNTPDRESKQSPQRARLSGHSVVLIYHIDIDDILKKNFAVFSVYFGGRREVNIHERLLVFI